MPIDHPLRSPPCSKGYFWILIYKNKGIPLSGYRLIALVYGKGKPMGSYSTVFIKRLVEHNLVTVKKLAKGDRVAKVYEPNYLEFAKALNEFGFPEDKKLNEEELKELAKLLEEIRFDLIIGIDKIDRETVAKYEPKTDIINLTLTFLKMGAILSEIFEKHFGKIDEEKLESVKVVLGGIGRYVELAKPFLKVSKELRERLKYAQPDPVYDTLLLTTYIFAQSVDKFFEILKKGGPKRHL